MCNQFSANALAVEDNSGNTPIMAAVLGNKLTTVQWLIEPDKFLGDTGRLDAVNNKKQNALMLAASAGHLEILTYFTDWWEKIGNLNRLSEQDNQGKNVLEHALDGGHAAIVLKLLGLHVWGFCSFKALLRAIENKNLSLSQLLINRDTGILLQKNTLDERLKSEPGKLEIKRGMRVIHYAAKYGFIELIQWIIEQHGRILLKQQTKGGLDVLMIAVRYQQLHLVHWLISTYGFDSFLKKTMGISHLMIAAYNNDFIMLKDLLKLMRTEPLYLSDFKGNTAFSYALFQKNSNAFRILLKAHEHHNKNLVAKGLEPIDYINENLRFNALLHAAYVGNLNLVKWLIKTGPEALYRRVNKEGQTVIMYAASGQQLAVIDWLLELGGMTLLEEKDHQGKTAFLWAISRDGLKNEFKQMDGSPLKYEDSVFSPLFLRELLNRGDEQLLKQKDCHGMTAVMSASVRFDWKLLLELIQTGQVNLVEEAKFNERSFKNVTAVIHDCTSQILYYEAKRVGLGEKFLSEYFPSGASFLLDENLVQVFNENKDQYIARYLECIYKPLNWVFHTALLGLIYDYFEYNYYSLSAAVIQQSSVELLPPSKRPRTLSFFSAPVLEEKSGALEEEPLFGL